MPNKHLDTNLSMHWALVAPLLPSARPGGRPRTTDTRAVVNAATRLMLNRIAPSDFSNALSVPVHPHLTGPIRPTRGHIPTSPHARFIRDTFAVPDLHRPRRPTSGSELSSMLFRNMSSSTTTGNSSAACTQYFTEDPSLHLRMTVSAFPRPHTPIRMRG